jgi:hypothetical protein
MHKKWLYFYNSTLFQILNLSHLQAFSSEPPHSQFMPYALLYHLVPVDIIWSRQHEGTISSWLLSLITARFHRDIMSIWTLPSYGYTIPAFTLRYIFLKEQMKSKINRWKHSGMSEIFHGLTYNVSTRMVQKQHSFSRNHTPNFEFLIFFQAPDK